MAIRFLGFEVKRRTGDDWIVDYDYVLWLMTAMTSLSTMTTTIRAVLKKTISARVQKTQSQHAHLHEPAELCDWKRSEHIDAVAAIPWWFWCQDTSLWHKIIWYLCKWAFWFLLYLLEYIVMSVTSVCSRGILHPNPGKNHALFHELRIREQCNAEDYKVS